MTNYRIGPHWRPHRLQRTEHERHKIDKSSAVAEMGDRARAKPAEQWGPAVPLSVWRAGSPSNTSRLGWGLPPHQVSSWSIQPFGHNAPTLQTRQDRQDRQRSDSI